MMVITIIIIITTTSNYITRGNKGNVGLNHLLKKGPIQLSPSVTDLALVNEMPLFLRFTLNNNINTNINNNNK